MFSPQSDASSSDFSSSDSDFSSDSESEMDSSFDDTTMNDEFDDLELLLADRAEELAIAKSLGASFRVLEFVAESHHHGSKKVNVVVNRISKTMNIHAVRQKAAQVRQFVRTFLSNDANTTNNRIQGTNGTEFNVTTDSDGRRQISRVESLEKELADLKAMMKSLQSGGHVSMATAAETKTKTTTQAAATNSTTASTTAQPRRRAPPPFLAQIGTKPSLRQCKWAVL